MALVALWMASGATAQTVTAANVESVASAIQSAGYKAELAKDDAGDPFIKSASGGSNFVIFFYGCKSGRNCTTVQFFAGYRDATVSLSKLNEWNAAHRFTRVYLTDKGAVRIEMDVDLDEGGMSATLFRDNLALFSAAMGSFEKTLITK